MSVENTIKESEILLREAAEFDDMSESCRQNAPLWKDIVPEYAEEWMEKSSGYALTAANLQESVWNSIRTSFHNEGFDVNSAGNQMFSEKFDIVIRSEIMDYYKKSSQSSK